MTDDGSAAQALTPTRPGRRAELLAAAIAALTEAARLTWSCTDKDGRVTSEQADWAEFVTHALAGAAANIGGIETVLAGRPGSWEADYVRNLLTSTVGHDEAYLLEHRTEPLAVTLFVDEILADTGTWKAYDDAQQEVQRRYDAIGVPSSTQLDDPLDVATDEQERQIDEIADLEERLEQLRERDWAEYGQALKAHVEAAAAQLPGLQVPVVVTVDLHTWPAQPREYDSLDDRLITDAIQATPAPVSEPLQRISQTARESS